MNRAANTEKPDDKVNTYIAKSPVNTGLLADVSMAAVAHGMEKFNPRVVVGGEKIAKSVFDRSLDENIDALLRA